ncbi:hypothetical protein ACOUH1_11145 [Acinetobacter baumannii]|uniref:hypothetical protein n=1 Tax=Acinetobacter lwoffii TaxID=28090 RepID=UPI00144422C4|nr:hypothetical protein [Acinetobacter lwoffii]MCU4616286.1 hypothetical protein [Acinetobacter lwoffii]NKS45370.1 hypothetical protein [Acinetobacter lwoffii]
MLQTFLAKFYEAVIIALAAFLLLALIGFGVQTWRVSAWQDDYTLLDAKYKTDLATAEALTEKAKADAIAKEKQWSEKLLKAEIQHREDIKQIITDSNSAKSAIDRLSRQIDTASSRMSTATRETIIEYASASGVVLEKCVNEYRTVAQRADEHAADAKRLSDAWP